MTVAMLFAVAGAQGATWTFKYAGEGTWFIACQDLPDCPPPIVGPWNPIITFETISVTDGIYSGTFGGPLSNPADTLTRVVMAGDLFFLVGGEFDTAEQRPVGTFSATIVGGRVSSFHGSFLEAFGGPDDEETHLWDIRPIWVRYEAGHASPLPFPAATGFALPIPIPEPATYALMISGLGLVGAMQRGRRPKADRQTGRVVSSTTVDHR